jgi:hypothetical protein
VNSVKSLASNLIAFRQIKQYAARDQMFQQICDLYYTISDKRTEEEVVNKERWGVFLAKMEKSLQTTMILISKRIYSVNISKIVARLTKWKSLSKSLSLLLERRQNDEQKHRGCN